MKRMRLIAIAAAVSLASMSGLAASLAGQRAQRRGHGAIGRRTGRAHADPRRRDERRSA
jgi:hypothetical protein